MTSMTDVNLKFRWYRLTPDRFVIGLLVVECLLWLSERFQWFSFNAHKGWTVLFAVAVVGLAFLVMLLWFIAALLFRWRFQFSIRSLLVLTVAVVVPYYRWRPARGPVSRREGAGSAVARWGAEWNVG
jgi:membrane protein YdbS with pleckstrin-like domain